MQKREHEARQTLTAHKVCCVAYLLCSDDAYCQSWCTPPLNPPPPTGGLRDIKGPHQGVKEPHIAVKGLIGMFKGRATLVLYWACTSLLNGYNAIKTSVVCWLLLERWHVPESLSWHKIKFPSDTFWKKWVNVRVLFQLSLSSDRQHLSYDVCLEVRWKIIRTVLCCIVYWSCA